MTKLITAFAVVATAAGVLISPNLAQAAGTFSSIASADNSAQVIQIKDVRRKKRGRSRHHRRNRHRHVGGHFYFGHDYFDRPTYRGCRYLKRKARHTGSRYWWNKYYRCMDRHSY